ncbi:MAG: SDR family oxidoreductase [Rhodospirillaceae bacterium]|jgi:3-oxoacyl-[acyl-carrier protein] reductase|nr:SDR family oxidoreductase [Rhodospirillaceae bacterium]MBT3490710.1 SDR family oxidoreductase [Rhodospirillaceae bacterium]MBT3783013.1 SDR family oxidoreductase [Rhodospirillaceae bacterium]MBT3976314.1 SDR family oxidoreductase [Rhodospirillaceae bacterium]MBT4169220.1 SDR family oxidoreductase [Rhodospirillaceae bacterium]
MKLGIAGKAAIVCAASKGLGKGCALALAQEGVAVTISARGEEALAATAEEIRSETGVTVRAVVCDVTTSLGRSEILAACPQPDILINNAGGPPAGDFRDFTMEDWQRAVNANMLSPIEMIKATVDGMLERGFGRIVNITSSSVRSPIDELCLSNGARCGLTGFVAGLSRKTIRRNVTINNLLPGPFDTDRLRGNIAHRAEAAGKEIAEMREISAANNPAGRFGTVEEFGATCAFMCSVHTGYMTGQQIMMDGGAFSGTM